MQLSISCESTWNFEFVPCSQVLRLGFKQINHSFLIKIVSLTFVKFFFLLAGRGGHVDWIGY